MLTKCSAKWAEGPRATHFVSMTYEISKSRFGEPGLARAIASLAEVTLHFAGRSNGRTGVEDRRLAVDLLLLAYNDVAVGRERFADTRCAETQA